MRDSHQTNTGDVLRMHVVVQGRVQGVGFRYTTKNHAQALKLVGTVRNLPDGSVEIFVQGPRKTIETFFQQLQQDFAGSISSITSKECDVNHTDVNFQVL